MKIYRFGFWGAPNVLCAFQHGVSSYSLTGNISFMVDDDPEKVLQARNELFNALPGMNCWRECHQIHSSYLLKDPEPTGMDGRNLAQADGMMTSRPGMGLLIKTADCQPVFVAHKSGKYVMALHVGWRGNRANFPGLAVKSFCLRYGLAPGDLLAVRGPSLGPLSAEFVNFASEWGEDFAQWWNPADKCLNLWDLTRWQLARAGIPQENIYGLDIDTRMNDQDFFSFRSNRNTGRQGSLIWIRAD